MIRFNEEDLSNTYIVNKTVTRGIKQAGFGVGHKGQSESQAWAKWLSTNLFPANAIH